jgi:hypothetical protein
VALRNPADVNYWLVAGIVLFLAGGALLVRKIFLKDVCAPAVHAQRDDVSRILKH